MPHSSAPILIKLAEGQGFWVATQDATQIILERPVGIHEWSSQSKFEAQVSAILESAGLIQKTEMAEAEMAGKGYSRLHVREVAQPEVIRQPQAPIQTRVEAVLRDVGLDFLQALKPLLPSHHQRMRRKEQLQKEFEAKVEAEISQVAEVIELEDEINRHKEVLAQKEDHLACLRTQLREDRASLQGAYHFVADDWEL